MSQRTVYFHEDDYCQIEILPAQNLSYCAEQLALIGRFSEQHRAPNNTGWTDIYLRGKAPMSVDALALDINRVSALLTKHMQAFDRIESGCSSHRERCKNIRAFGFDDHCVVYVSYNRPDLVGWLMRKPCIAQDIWLGLGHIKNSKLATLRTALEELNSLGAFLLIDWSSSNLLLLSEKEKLAAYLEDYGD